MASKISLNGFDLGEQTRGLAMQTKHVHLAIHTLGNRHNRFIDGASGERELFLETSEEFQRHSSDETRWLDRMSDKGYYVNLQIDLLGPPFLYSSWTDWSIGSFLPRLSLNSLPKASEAGKISGSFKPERRHSSHRCCQQRDCGRELRAGGGRIG